jgi:hypothetical protein
VVAVPKAAAATIGEAQGEDEISNCTCVGDGAGIEGRTGVGRLGVRLAFGLALVRCLNVVAVVETVEAALAAASACSWRACQTEWDERDERHLNDLAHDARVQAKGVTPEWQRWWAVRLNFLEKDLSHPG